MTEKLDKVQPIFSPCIYLNQPPFCASCQRRLADIGATDLSICQHNRHPALYEQFVIKLVVSQKLQSLTQKKSNFARGKAKLSQPARQLSFAYPRAKLLFFCVKDCKVETLCFSDLQGSCYISRFNAWTTRRGH